MCSGQACRWWRTLCRRGRELARESRFVGLGEVHQLKLDESVHEIRGNCSATVVSGPVLGSARGLLQPGPPLGGFILATPGLVKFHDLPGGLG